MKKENFGLLLVIILSCTCIVNTGCSPEAKYNRMVKKGLASGIRSDSIFMGLYLGMPEKEFYTHCWNLNHKGLIRQGESNTTVLYEIKNELKYPATMDFYPNFSDGKIFEIPVRIKYKGWAPWNKNLTAEKLQNDVLNWYKKEYGRGFMTVRHPTRGPAYVKVDGNRRITIFIQNDLYVWAVFTDLLVKRDWMNLNNDTGKLNDSITGGSNQKN